MPEKTAATLASATTYGASGGAILFGTMTVNELAALFGILLGSATFCVNWYYRHKMYRLSLAQTKQDDE